MDSAVRLAELAPLVIETAPLRQKIIVAIRQAIERGLFKPGDRLVERDLRERLNVSRTALREALRELEAHRVVTVSSTRGMIVTPLTIEEAENIYCIRAELECVLVEQFIDRATVSDLGDFKTVADHLCRSYALHRLDDILDAKRTYYEKLCRGARNSIAYDIISTLSLRTSHLRSTSLTRETRQMECIGEIEAIVKAVEAGDKQAAKAAARKHIEAAMASAFWVYRNSVPN